MLSRLEAVLDERGLLQKLPGKVCEHLRVARGMAVQQQRIVRWEVKQIQRALAGTGAPIVLLKGAAYVMAEVPPARGRLFSDVDFMVPKEQLVAVEERLLKNGWEFLKLDAYDERYYRTWMHELPPLQHPDRHIVVDVHHNILPATSRLHPDPRLLLDAARPLGDSRLEVLAPADMVLHTAAHMFQDGELQGDLRDVIDLDGLMRHFSTEAGFWDGLVSRARRLELERPLFYALRYTERLLGTPVPQEVKASARGGAPPWPTAAIMDALVTRVLVPEHPDHPRWATRVARRLLYVRSHWLRMPPLLLARHLLRKSLKRRAWAR